jgi:hypothetical protein
MAPAPQGGGVGQVVRLDPLLGARVLASDKNCDISSAKSKHFYKRLAHRKGSRETSNSFKQKKFLLRDNLLKAT